MKIMKLLLLLSLGLWGEFKLDISQSIDVAQLENIVKNGWNDTNKTLNDLIVAEAERLMPEILEKLEKPVLKGIVTEQYTSPLPIFLLTRDDYILTFSYSKYLEFNNKTDIALNLYLKSLMGLNNIEDKTMLSTMFHLVIEALIVDNLKKNTEILSKLEYGKVHKVLILNTNILRDTLRKDQQGMIETLTLNSGLPKEILTLIRKYNASYTKAYMKIKNKDELLKFEKIFNNDKKEIEIKYTDLIDKHVIPDDIARDKLIASYIFLIGLPRFRLIEDFWANIERNKKLLDSL